MHLVRRLGAALATLALLPGCGLSIGSGDGEPAGGHTHGSGDAMVSLLVGDGTERSQVGYSLTDVSLPPAAGVSGEVRFRIVRDGEGPVTRFIAEQTKNLHLYLIRTDHAVFRHLHPTMGPDGTWSARVRLPEPGDYRVVVEFVAEDSGGNGDFLMLGDVATVPGVWAPQQVETPDLADDGVLSVTATGRPRTGKDGRLTLLLRDSAGRPVALGSYLGTSAHVTAVHIRSGAIVHMHPYGEVRQAADGTRIEFHTEFEHAGDYRAYVQARVDGFLHTLPVLVTVA